MAPHGHDHGHGHLTEFTCQRCKQLIKLPDSFHDATSAYDFVNSVLEEQRHGQLGNDAGVSLHPIAESFILLDEQQQQRQKEQQQGHSKKDSGANEGPKRVHIEGPHMAEVIPAQDRPLAFSVRLFDLLSSTKEVDHPLCNDCTTTFIHAIKQQKEEYIKDRDRYRQLARELEEEESMTVEGFAKLQKELQDLEKEERHQLRELAQEEESFAHMGQELEQLKMQDFALDSEEREFLEMYLGVEDELRTLREKEYDIQCQLDHDTAVLDRLSQTNVFNDAFCIGHDGNFATINGLRLGRGTSMGPSLGTASPTPGPSSLPSPLEVSPAEGTSRLIDAREINASWGLATLCLATLAKIVRPPMTFNKYVPIPRGSFSKMQKNGNEYFELYLTDSASASGISGVSAQIGRLFPFQSRRYDMAMVYFLQAMDQLASWVERNGKEKFKLPYSIRKDQIGGISIRAQYASDADWTKACRYTLTNLKALMACVTRDTQP